MLEIFHKKKANAQMQISRKSAEIEVVTSWEKEDDTYFAPGALVAVKNGKGVLREVMMEPASQSMLSLMLGDKPLFQLLGDEYFCPTCEKILRSGYGLDQPELLRMERINESKDKVSFSEILEELYPLLGLLDSGYYTVWDTSLYPTDGNGHLFWEVPNEMAPLPGTCVYYYGDSEYADPHPYFMVGTQPRENYNPERVDYYRAHPGARAIAYFMDGYITALLDGHHKAFAAALEHEKVNALVIVPEYIARFRGADGQMHDWLTCGGGAVFHGNKAFDCEAYRLDSNLRRTRRSAVSEELADEVARYMEQVKLTCRFPVDTDELAKYYPSVDDVAAIDRAGAITDEGLDEWLGRIPGKGGYTEEDVCILMRALGAMKHKRLFEMGDHFSRHNYTGDTLYVILEAMMRLPRTPELEDYFIERMVELEDDYPRIRDLILGYW